MGVFRYWTRVLRAAFSHSLSVAQDAIFLAILVVGGAAALVPRARMTVDLAPWLTTLSGWSIAATAFGSIVIIRLVLAPYWIWKESQIEIGRLRGESDRLTSRPVPEVFFDPANPGCVRPNHNERTHETVIWYWIGIRNPSHSVSIDELTISLSPSDLTRELHAALFPPTLFPVFFGPAPLHPGHTEYVRLFGLSNSEAKPGTPAASGVWAHPQTIDIHVHGRDTEPVSKRFLIDPRATPSVWESVEPI